MSTTSVGGPAESLEEASPQAANYASWFARMTGHEPRPWQVALAASDAIRSRTIRIPTGYGKTLGVLGAWLYHRVERADPRWPRRLVWALPMRVLVEQTEDVVRNAVTALGLVWDSATDHEGKVGVHTLMGGADAGGDWHLHPEANAVLIGTQDMLLSRALNRGYGAGRARWPLELGLVSQDALWVLDEVQLMDVGVSTSAQIQAYLDEDGPRGFRPRSSWWMSATLQPEWLRSVDTAASHDAWIKAPVALGPIEREEGLAVISKRLTRASASDEGTLPTICATAHGELKDGEHGRSRWSYATPWSARAAPTMRSVR